MDFGKRAGKGLLVLVFWLGLWFFAARLVGRELLLPGPWVVLRRLAVLLLTADFWRITAVSLARILLGFALGVVLGGMLAAGTCRFALLDTLLAPLLTIIKSTPVASFILLALIWVGRSFLPCVIVILMVAPVVWTNISAGIRSADRQLLEMAQVYGFSPWRRILRVYAPAAAPYFFSALRSSLGLAWKAGVAAEVLTVPPCSIGKMLYESKLYLETVDLFAWTVVVILCSLIIEKLLAAAFSPLLRRYGGEGKS